MRIVLAILYILFLNTCKMGPATYETFKRNLDISVDSGSTFFADFKNRKNANKFYIKKTYNENLDIFVATPHNNIIDDIHPNCVWGFLVDKNHPKKPIVGWKILSGKEYCKEQKSYTILQ